MNNKYNIKICNNKIKVIFISHSSGLYGAERSLADLVIGLKKLGVEIVVVMPNDGPLKELLSSNDVAVLVFPYYGWLGKRFKLLKGVYRWLFNRIAAFRLKKVLDNFKADIVYTNTISTPIGLMLAKLLGVQHILHVREFVHEDMGADFDFSQSFVERKVKNSSSFIIYNSKAVADKFNSWFAGLNSKVIYNGILNSLLDATKYKIINSSVISPVLCMVGSIHRGKGQHVAIEALSILKIKHPGITLKIVGSGDEQYIKELKKLALNLDVSANLDWCGYHADISMVFQTSDAALVCSSNEAFGRVVVEAMSEGCPVVASNSGGIPEIINSGVNGLLFEKNCSKSLAQKIDVLLTDPLLYKNISINGLLDSHEKFSKEKYVKSIYEILLLAIGESIN